MPVRKLTAIEQKRLKCFSAEAIEVALINPTETCFEKAIIDATEQVQDFLKSAGVHDFGTQGRGALENGVKLIAHFFNEFGVDPVTVSLYRPKAKPKKLGDPRLWIYGLKQFAAPDDVLALCFDGTTLGIVNLSRVDLVGALSQGSSSPIFQLIHRSAKKSSSTATELLGKLRQISSRGLLPSVMATREDTAIGRTIESALGIPMNSSKGPDYKGIELKSARFKKNPNRHGLFGKVPNWKISKFNSMQEILDTFGNGSGAQRRLNSTQRATGFNPDRIKLDLSSNDSVLDEFSDKQGIGAFVSWYISDLQNALSVKHDETFWISARSHDVNGHEHFEFLDAVHTRKPLVGQFATLIKSGAITLDHQIGNKKGRAHERGPAFKISPPSFELLFPPNKTYSLK